MEQFAEAAGASLGGFVSSFVLFPMEIIKTKAAAEKDKSVSVLEIARREYARVGLSGLYAGAHVGGLQSSMEKFLYFYNFKALTSAYVGIRSRLAGTGSEATGSQVGFLADVAIGYLAEWSHLPISLPADAIQTRMKVQGISWTEAFRSMQAEVGTPHPAGNGRKRTYWDVFYKVLFPFVILCLKPAIQNTIFERIKAIVLRQQASAGNGAAVVGLSAVQAFVVGAIARAIATLVVFPYNRIKILLQTSKVRLSSAGGESLRGEHLMFVRHLSSRGGVLHKTCCQEKSSGTIASRILEESGLLGFWQGVGPDISRGVVSAALMLAVKERIQLVIKTLLGVAPKVAKKLPKGGVSA